VTESQVAPDQSWAELAHRDESERGQEMAARCREVAALPEEERIARLEAMVRAEYSLADEELRPFTLSRLRAWLALKDEDDEQAKLLAHGYDSVFNRLPGDMAMRRATVVQGIAREKLAIEEIEQLFELIPSLMRSVPRSRTDTVSRQAAANAAAREAGAVAADQPWWKFWTRLPARGAS
jgi:hypothetical protein